MSCSLDILLEIMESTMSVLESLDGSFNPHGIGNCWLHDGRYQVSRWIAGLGILPDLGLVPWEFGVVNDGARVGCTIQPHLDGRFMLRIISARPLERRTPLRMRSGLFILSPYPMDKTSGLHTTSPPASSGSARCPIARGQVSGG